ncbi:MAG TPA: TorF family putative porin [Burkholderiales bacterium]|nr:TorF family putative porin [Burkholderiales bacterium]
MRKLVVPLALAASASASGIASAQQAAAPAPSPVTGNMTLVSEYRFRGIDQTFGKPAIQGGFDYSHASGVYLGNWNSNVSQGAGYWGGNIEMDFYGGYKKAFGDVGLDVGAIYYYYPGSDANASPALALSNPHAPGQTNSGTVHNFEGYIGGSWKWLSLKWFHAFSDYFQVPDTKGTNYIDLSATYDLGAGWGVNGHVGRLKVHNYSEADYTDYKLGVTKDLTGWVFGASLIATDAKGSCPAIGVNPLQPYCFPNSSGTKTKDAGRSTIVFSVGKTF